MARYRQGDPTGGGGGAATGATWTTTKDLDFTADVTNIASLTFGGGEVTLYEADGTTEKATIRADVRVGAPTKSANVTSGAGFQVLSYGASDGSDISVLFDPAGSSWEDPGVTMSDENPIAIDIALSGLVLNVANNDNVTFMVADSFLILGGSTVEARGGYMYRVNASSYNMNGRRVVGASNELGSATDNSATQSTSVVYRLLIWRAGYAEIFWERGTTTLLEGIPTVAGGVFKKVIGAENIAIDGSLPIPDAFYLVIEAFSASGTATDREAVLERIRIQELA